MLAILGLDIYPKKIILQHLSVVGMGFPCGSAGEESACSARVLGSIPGLGRSPGEGKGYLLSYSGLENSIDCIVHGVAESDMTERLSLFTFRQEILQPLL